MKISLITLAHYAALAEGNKLVIAGTINQFEMRRRPGMPMPEDGLGIPLPAFHIAVTAFCSIAEGTTHQMFLRVSNDDQQVVLEPMPIGTWTFQVNRFGRPMQTNQVINVQGLMVPGPGDYTIEILKGTEPIGDTPLYVVDVTPPE